MCCKYSRAKQYKNSNPYRDAKIGNKSLTALA